MTERTAHLAIYDGLVDFEVGHLLAELRTGRFTGEPFQIRAVGLSGDPVTTMAGLDLTPDMSIAETEPADSSLLVLPGAELWDRGGGGEFADLAARFLAAKVPVAAICGAAAGLARAGLLDRRRHTSAAAEYLEATGYAGGALYVEERAVADDGLVTAGPQSPVQFATATLGLLGLASDEVLEAYEDLFHRADPRAFPRLMAATAG